MPVEASLDYHWRVHGQGVPFERYLADSADWRRRIDVSQGVPVPLADGTTGYRFRAPDGGSGGIIDSDGNIISFWYDSQ